MLNKTFTNEQMTGLPEPVQRYFERVLKHGQQYISYARIKREGEFKPVQDKDWVNITGEQYGTTEKRGFIWKGTTAMLTARNIYIADKRRLALINVLDGKRVENNQGELLRWIGERILYPPNLLSGERLRWSSINARSAKFSFNYNEFSLFYIVTFNDVGEITQLETKRYMDKGNLGTWIIKLADYKELNGIIVPTTFEVLLRFKEGDLSYAKFNIQKIEYNKP